MHYRPQRVLLRGVRRAQVGSGLCLTALVSCGRARQPRGLHLYPACLVINISLLRWGT